MVNLALIISYCSLGFLGVSPFVLVFFWKDYYFIYDYRILFVIGVAYSRFLTDYAVTSVLSWYFTYYGDNLVMSSVLTNIQGLLSSFFVIFMAHAADSYLGRFYTLLFSNTAYISGLMLMWLFNPYDVKWLVVIALVLISLGTSGANTLDDVLLDLVNHIDKSQDMSQDERDERSRARAYIWLRIAYVFAAISAILWVATDAVGQVLNPSWRTSFLICIISMTVTSFIFFKGHNIYHQGPLTKRPIEAFYRVFRGRITEVLKDNSRLIQTNVETGRQPPLRLDTYKKKDEVVVKTLLRMFPMWAMFFVVTIISATGFTFFLLQYSNLNVSKTIPIQIYNVAQDISVFSSQHLYRWLNFRRFRKNQKVKIGVGMLCGIISCIFAWRLEVHRLHEVNKLVDKDSNTSISFLWLVPQFCALGCMDGLTQDGLIKFYKSQIDKEPLINYGEEYIEMVMSLGKLFNIIVVLVFNSQLRWFQDTINDSRLDKYYLFLVCAGSVNFVLYCLLARCFYMDVASKEDKEHKDEALGNDDQQQHHQELVGEVLAVVDTVI